ncbi:MAG: 2,3-bisphosphoglycerate-independent phosphoglycerate mutase [Candidatus Kuenenbacteria bacterium]
MTSRPVLLVILDGWGVAAPTPGNAVTSANLPYWDYLLANYPSTLLQASGPAVGLPWGKMGNSEVGHLTMGSGQIFPQSLDKINKSISSGDFFNNPAFLKAINHVKNNNSNLHLIGLLGDGGIHAHSNHLYSLIELACQNGLNNNTFLHLFLDGRDTAKDEGILFLEKLKSEINQQGCSQIASLSGRFYGMDRNNNWDRIKKSFDVMTGRSKNIIQDPMQAVRDSYNKKIFDEEFEPIAAGNGNKPLAKIDHNDAVIFFNFRSDRARQLTQSFVLDEFKEFERGQKLNNLLFVCFSEYKKGLPIEIAFPRPVIKNSLAEILSNNNLKQLHLAETEKYAHVTFFLNGLNENPFSGEARLLVPSPALISYDKKPEMSSYEIKDNIISALDQCKFDFIVANFANPDMIGHTGNMQACVKALEAADKCLSEIIETVIKHGGQALITADHGNIEEVINLETGQIDKEHSNFPVPAIIVKEEYKSKFLAHKNSGLCNVKIKGALVDIAPTILSMLGLDKNEKMIGIDLQKVIED